MTKRHLDRIGNRVRITVPKEERIVLEALGCDLDNKSVVEIHRKGKELIIQFKEK
jgi:formamidopyrimidine-DNA glycosylase